VPQIATRSDSDEDTYTDATKWTFDAQPNCDWPGERTPGGEPNRELEMRCAIGSLAPGYEEGDD